MLHTNCVGVANVAYRCQYRLLIHCNCGWLALISIIKVRRTFFLFMSTIASHLLGDVLFSTHILCYWCRLCCLQQLNHSSTWHSRNLNNLFVYHCVCVPLFVVHGVADCQRRVWQRLWLFLSLSHQTIANVHAHIQLLRIESVYPSSTMCTTDSQQFTTTHRISARSVHIVLRLGTNNKVRRVCEQQNNMLMN